MEIRDIQTSKAFFVLIKAGLWEIDVQLSRFGTIDYDEIYRLAEEQSVVGLVAAGIEHVIDAKIPQEVVLQFVGQTLQLEQRNSAMNSFIGDLVKKMREAEIYTVLVKGQGIAQCYERPLWRTFGDVDLLLSDANYERAKGLLFPLSSNRKAEEFYSKHQGLSIRQWYVEIHGTLRTGLSSRVDKEVDAVQKDVFCGGNVRSWLNGQTQVFLPSPDNDVFFVFTHFIKHFYKEGMNLRQVCDWCRLLWTFREIINRDLLKKRLEKSGLMKEWKVFASMAVGYLGMPQDFMPLYDSSYNDKGLSVVEHILRGSMGNVIRDTWSIAKIFPCQTFRFSPAIFFNVNSLKIKERLFG